jgi:formylmethanofuran dehydrogenase subunit E
MERTWEMCIEFHGHACPVLATGYRMSKEALRILEVADLHTHKLVCIAENKVCGVDSIQIMLNCTLAKGNIIIRDTAKQVYTVVRQDTGNSVRFSLREKYALPWPDPEKWPDTSDWENLQNHIINDPVQEVFDIKTDNLKIQIPFVGYHFQRHACAKCGELVSEYAVRIKGQRYYCRDCYETPLPQLNNNPLIPSQ